MPSAIQVFASPDMARWGWSLSTPAFLESSVHLQSPTLGRVLEDHGAAWHVTLGAAPHVMRLHPRHTGPVPVTGDFVAAVDDGGTPWILETLPRRGELVRAAAGTAHARQTLAANVDALWLVTGADHDLSERRLHRMAAVGAHARVPVAVVLTRVDLCHDVDAAVALVERALPGAHVMPVNATDALQVDACAVHLDAGRTYALLGSSGVGKSTLTNTLLGHGRQDTQTPNRDGKGRHTTSGRQLFVLPNGALMMDTPGLREVGMGGEVESVDAVFADLAALAERCRFADCRHRTEPGCAVLAAQERGQVDEARVASWHALRAESAWRSSLMDVAVAQERKRNAKVISRAVRRAYKEKR